MFCDMFLLSPWTLSDGARASTRAGRQWEGEDGRGWERKGEEGRGRERKGEEGRGRERKGEEGRGRERKGAEGRMDLSMAIAVSAVYLTYLPYTHGIWRILAVSAVYAQYLACTYGILSGDCSNAQQGLEFRDYSLEVRDEGRERRESET